MPLAETETSPGWVELPAVGSYHIADPSFKTGMGGSGRGGFLLSDQQRKYPLFPGLFKSCSLTGVGSGVSNPEKGVEHLNEFKTNRAQLGLMGERELAQYLFSLWGKVDKNPSLVNLIPIALDETSLNEPINQLDGAMMGELEPLVQGADGRFPSQRQTLHGKEQLLLLGSRPAGLADCSLKRRKRRS